MSDDCNAIDSSRACDATPLSRFLDEYYRKQFESRTETVQMASNDQMAQESITVPRLDFFQRNYPIY